jgi:hypothetical protein
MATADGKRRELVKTLINYIRDSYFISSENDDWYCHEKHTEPQITLCGCYCLDCWINILYNEIESNTISNKKQILDLAIRVSRKHRL